MTDPAEPIRWIKSLLSKSLDWPDMPPNTPGRVILKKWPASQVLGSKGIIIAAPTARHRLVNGVAWVYRAIGAVAEILHPGDSVILPAYEIDAGTMFPSADGSNDEYREVQAEGILHFLPYEQALAEHLDTCAAVEAEFQAAAASIEKMLAEGQGRMAVGELLEWLAKESFLSEESRKRVAELSERAQPLAAKEAYAETAGKVAVAK
jgi:hypothetical protein